MTAQKSGMEYALEPTGELVEDKLVARCVVGDDVAWRALHRRYYPVAAAFLRRLGVRQEELDDALQEVFVSVFRALPGFRGDADLKTWLYRICATSAHRVRRKRNRISAVRSVLSLVAPRSTQQTLPEETVAAKVDAALNCLTDGERLVFVLYELEGLDGAQVAEVAECSVPAVWRRLHYARKKFRDAIRGAA